MIKIQDALLLPGLPVRPEPGGPPGDGGDAGGDSAADEGETPRDTDEDHLPPQRPKPYGDPDSSGDDGGKGRRKRAQTPMTINKWAKPIPKLAVTYWHQVCPEYEERGLHMRSATCMAAKPQSQSHVTQLRHFFDMSF